MKTIINTLALAALLAPISNQALAGRPSPGENNFVNALVCALPIEVGMCRAAMQRWAFENGQCVEFIYGGCGGNANNFRSKEACEAQCAPQE